MSVVPVGISQILKLGKDVSILDMVEGWKVCLGNGDACLEFLKHAKNCLQGRQANSWAVEFFDTGGYAVLGKCVESHSGNVMICNDCCMIYSMLARYSTLKDPMWQHGAQTVVIALMREFRESSVVQENSCAMLCNLAILRANRYRLLELNLLPDLLSILELHFRQPAALQKACSLLQYCIAYDIKERERERDGPMEERLITAILQALTAHPTSSILHEKAFSALAALALQSDNRNFLMQSDVSLQLIRTLQNHGSSFVVTEQACRLLQALVSANEAYAMQFMKEGISSILLEAMQSHLQSVSVQSAGCASLEKLARHHGVAKLLMRERVFLNVYESMEQFANNTDVLSAACLCLAQLSQWPDTANELVRQGVIAVIVQRCLEQAAESLQGNLVLSSLRAMHAIASHPTLRKEVLAVPNMNTLLLRCIQQQGEREDIAETGLAVLKNLSTTENKVKLVTDMNLVQMLVAQVQLHGENEQVVQEAMKLLEKCSTNLQLHPKIHAMEAPKLIANGIAVKYRNNREIQISAAEFWRQMSSSTEAKRAMQAQSVLTLLIDGLEAHYKTDREVSVVFLRTLQTLATEEDAVLELASAQLSLNVILETFRVHVNREEVLERGCGLLEQICLIPLAREKLGDLKVYVTILSAMRMAPTHAQIQSCCCHCIALIATDAKYKELFMTEGVADAVLSAMRAHGTNPGIQAHGCMALKNMAGSSKHKQELLKMGATPVIRAAMEAHPEDTQVQSEGCGALFQLLSQAKNKKAILNEPKLLDIIAGAVRAHGNDGEVQKNGRNVLQALGISGRSDKVSKPKMKWRIGAAKAVENSKGVGV